MSRARLAVAAALAILLAGAPAAAQNFRADGPNADLYGRQENYPSCAAMAFIRELRCRVGAFSHFDSLYPARAIAARGATTPLRRAAEEPRIRYVHEGRERTLDDYLDTRPVTGFLIARGDTILVERYQYGRNDQHRLTSFSMAKSIVGLLIGAALADGAINSLNDFAETYATGLRGSEYGRTPIKALLQMTSGVTFREDYNDPASDIYRLADLALGQNPGGSLAALANFNVRRAQPGALFSYSSADTVALGLVLAGATGRTVAEYASEKLWGPIGAEADASWIVDGSGQEIVFAYVNAVLRDWARLGLMLAHDGVWQDRSVVSGDWLVESTSVGPDSPFRSPATSPIFPAAYGYQFWIAATGRRLFSLRGLRGQFVLVDPEHKLVLVQTALDSDDAALLELFSLWRSLPAQLP